MQSLLLDPVGYPMVKPEACIPIALHACVLFILISLAPWECDNLAMNSVCFCIHYSNTREYRIISIKIIIESPKANPRGRDLVSPAYITVHWFTTCQLGTGFHFQPGSKKSVIVNIFSVWRVGVWNDVNWGSSVTLFYLYLGISLI